MYFCLDIMIKDNYILKFLSTTLLVVVFFSAFIQPLTIVFSDIPSEVVLDFKESSEESSNEKDFTDEDSNEDETAVGFLSLVDHYLFFSIESNFNSKQTLFKSLTQETFLPPPDIA